MPLILKEATGRRPDRQVYAVFSGRCCIGWISQSDNPADPLHWRWRLAVPFEAAEPDGAAVSLEGALDMLSRSWRKMLAHMNLREIE